MCKTALHPNVTFIDNKIVILAVRILVGEVLDMGILQCSYTCRPQDQKQTQQTYASYSLTCGMLLTQNRIDSQFCPTGVAEALKNVAHCGLYWQLLSFEFFTCNLVDNVLLGQQFSNPDAAFTIGITARPDFAEIIDSCAQVIIS
jgi:hypothetical protein